MKITVIGGGPGGYVAAIRAAQLGAEVTIVEKNAFGGTCLNVGCIPTKVLLHTVKLYNEIKHSEQMAIEVDSYSINWNKLQNRKEEIVKQLVNGVKVLLQSNKVKIVNGTGKFINKNQIEVTNGTKKTILDFDSAIIATGSRPVVIPIEGGKLEGVINSDEALSLKEIPKTMCIIGGGVIGSEFATIYNALGTKVTVVEMMPNILDRMDLDIVNMIYNKLVNDGIEILTGSKVVKIQRSVNDLSLNIQTQKGEKILNAEKVLFSVGRKPSIENLGLEKIGIEVKNGRIISDEKMRTNIKGIYAVGDCTGGAMLAHTASAEGIVASENIMGEKSKMNLKVIPSCVYTNPEIASVGLTEKDAKEKGYSLKTGMFPLMANGKALIMNDIEGFIKFVVDEGTDEILGMHIVGPRATDLIVEGALAMRLEATIEEIVSTIHAHPTIGEAIAEAAHATHDLCIHLPKK